MQLSLWNLLDLVLLVVLLISLVKGSKKGFVHSLLDLATYVVTVLVAAFLCKAFAQIIYNKYIRDKLIEVISVKMATGTAGEIIEKLSSGFVGTLLKISGSSDKLTFYLDAAKSGSSAASLIVDNILKGPVLVAVKAVFFVITFVIVRIAARIIIKITDVINKLPVIGSLNKLLGAVVGFAEGFISCYIAVYIFSFFIGLFGVKSAELTQQAITHSYLYRFIYNTNLINYLLAL